jgi:hypothetical protein
MHQQRWWYAFMAQVYIEKLVYDALSNQSSTTRV